MSFRAEYGVKGDGLTMMVQPVSSAGAILPADSVMGTIEGGVS